MHSPTLLILMAILLGLMVLGLVASWFFSRRLRSQVYWAGAYLFAFLSVISLLTRSEQPGLAAILAAQGANFLTAYLMLMGVRCYMGRKPWPLSYGVLAGGGFIGAALFFTLVAPNPALRVVLVTVTVGSLFGLCAMTIAKGGISRFPARYAFALVSAIHTIFVFARLAFILRPDGQVIDLSGGANIPAPVILETIIALVMIAFTTLMLVTETMTNELRALAEMDALTNTFNRRSFLTLLDKAVSAAERGQSPLSVLLIDLDHFKQINDTQGHQVGDEVLRHFVAVAAASLRNEDVLGRIGGEEFAAFLPNAGAADALAIAERLRRSVAEQALNHGHGPIRLTISIGVAQCLPGEAVESVLHRADEAMYRAKESGRNRVASCRLSNAV